MFYQLLDDEWPWKHHAAGLRPERETDVPCEGDQLHQTQMPHQLHIQEHDELELSEEQLAPKPHHALCHH